MTIFCHLLSMNCHLMSGDYLNSNKKLIKYKNANSVSMLVILVLFRLNKAKYPILLSKFS